MTRTIPLRPSLAAWFRAQARAWAEDALTKMRYAQDEFGWAETFAPGSIKRETIEANARQIEREAQALFGSAERWAP